MLLSNLSLILEGGPRWHRVGEDSVLLLRHSMARLEGDTARLHPFNVAVGAYGMLTNASAHVDRLREAGYDKGHNKEKAVKSNVRVQPCPARRRPKVLRHSRAVRLHTAYCAVHR